MENVLNPEDIEYDAWKILIATDIHLGYNEKHQIRDDDTFITFEEILKTAVREEVDFILLGGDLFHDCKPSPYCIQKCSELIKRYCFGNKMVAVEFLSDQSYHFQHLRNPIVNYEDPNINISIPIFSIHGNHDDPTGSKSISALDLLSTNGLVNYFGKWNDLKSIEIVPMLLKKGSQKLALHGLSHIHDQRLARLFRDQKVSMMNVDEDDWFNLFVLHQNRAHRGANNFIPSTFIPNFIDLVIWGHEHDCLIVPEKQPNGVWISQPGSSVATSLSQGESLEKHIGVLYVQKKSFFMKPIRLQTVRPFIFKEIVLKEVSELRRNDVCDLAKDAVQTATREIEAIIEEVARDRKEKKLKDMLPLIRLVIRYHDERQQFNSVRLNQNFIGRVANPEDIVLQKPLVITARTRNRFMDDLDGTDLPEDIDTDVDIVTSVIDLVNQEFAKQTLKVPMNVLLTKSLDIAVKRMLEVDDADSVKDLFDHQVKFTVNKLIDMDATAENLDASINSLYENRIRQEAENIEISQINNMFEDKKRQFQPLAMEIDDDELDADDSIASTSTAPAKPARGRGSRGGRPKSTGQGRGRGRGRGRGKNAVVEID